MLILSQLSALAKGNNGKVVQKEQQRDGMQAGEYILLPSSRCGGRLLVRSYSLAALLQGTKRETAFLVKDCLRGKGDFYLVTICQVVSKPWDTLSLGETVPICATYSPNWVGTGARSALR